MFKKGERYTMKKTIIINGETFSSKTKAQEKAKLILNSYRYNETLNMNDFNFMYSYFEFFHYEWILKKGVGIESISIKKSERNKSNEFRVNRVDNSATDISYILSKIQEPKPIIWLKDAFRNEIHDDIMKFKDDFFKNGEIIKCEITGDNITRVNTHIDHYNPTFEGMFQTFIQSNKILITEDLFEKSKDNQTVPILKDEKILNDFREYHLNNCNLRAISIRANLSTLKNKTSSK